jgi:hypothetical protein
LLANRRAVYRPVCAVLSGGGGLITRFLPGFIERYFGDFQLEKDGKPLPVVCYFMPKSANFSGLEVADFIANTIGGHARHHLVGPVRT